MSVSQKVPRVICADLVAPSQENLSQHGRGDGTMELATSRKLKQICLPPNGSAFPCDPPCVSMRHRSPGGQEASIQSSRQPMLGSAGVNSFAQAAAPPAMARNARVSFIMKTEENRDKNQFSVSNQVRGVNV